MGIVNTKNLCLKCWFYVQGKCVKQPDDWCRITRCK